MPLLRVIEPGMFTTVQDQGRPGQGAIGVPPSGAADSLSLTIGNRLLGNSDHAAAVEFTLLGPSVTLDCDAWVCLTGAACPGARVAGTEGPRPLPWCEPSRVRAGELIKIGRTSDGARGYLCLSGGIGVSPVLGSRSTLAGAHLGGHEGRRFREGDAVPMFGTGRTPRVIPGEFHAWLRARLGRRTLRAMPSLHTDRFPAEAIERFVSAAYTVSAQSDRVGVRLEGPAIPIPDNAGLLESEPTVTGGIQIPGDALPIVLGVDRPTTGGYPLLACVIRADLGALAMLRPRDTVRFEICTIEEARRLDAEQRLSLDRCLPPCEEGPDA